MINNKITIGVSVGDINGIGTEVIIKTFDNPAMLELCTPVIFGSSKLISYYKKLCGSDMPFVGIDNVSQIIPGKVNIVNLWQEAPVITPGRDTEEGGRLAFESLKAATSALKKGQIDALVTAPINKKNIQCEGFHFQGHTEYLASELGGEALMFLISDSLKVAVATGHISISDVNDAITDALIEKKINQMEESLRRDFRVEKPRIAVLGLDPHTGDGGVIGTKDSEIIAPLIRKMFDEGHYVFGPYPSDGFFGNGAYTHFDATLAMYHDQGLIPFKTIAFEDGVNFTAGLSRVRTSPDHGTGYDIAGKNAADAQSFRRAVYEAIDIFKARMEYEHLTENVLRSQKIRAASVAAAEDEPDMRDMEG